MADKVDDKNKKTVKSHHLHQEQSPGALPYWVILGCAARMGEFSRPKTYGWV